MSTESVGRWYADGDYVVRQGDKGSCMYVVQKGELEVIEEDEGRTVWLGTLLPGAIFGEMALFEHSPRSASVRAIGGAQVLTVDKRTLLRRIKEDPLVATHLMEILCSRIRDLDSRISELESRTGAAAMAPSQPAKTI
jgi:CRP-like cAMP-binding protein